MLLWVRYPRSGDATMSDDVSLQALSTLVASIYDCALDPCRWEQTLSEIKDALLCDRAAIRLSDLRCDRLLISRTVGVDQHWQKQHSKYLPRIHAQFAANLATSPAFDEPHILSRHTSRAYFETCPFVNEYMKPQGLVDNMYCFLMKTAARLAWLVFARNERQGIITDREVVLTRLLLPHIRRAVTISNVLDAQTIEQSRMVEVLDALRCAVVLTDARGTILHANRSAEHMLRNGRPIRNVGGILHATAPSAATELRTAIGLAARHEVEIGKTGLAVALTEPGAPTTFAHLLPLTGSELRTRLQPTAIAAVFIGATPDAQDAAEASAAAFELTPAETRVLASLLGGATLAETAAALGVAISTAKTHLDSIFSKTGVTRQTELMRLGMGLVPSVKTNE